MFLKIRRVKNPDYCNERIEAMAKQGCWKKTKAPYVDVKAVIFGAVWIFIIADVAISRDIDNRFSSTLYDTKSTNASSTGLDTAVHGIGNDVARIAVSAYSSGFSFFAHRSRTKYSAA